MEFPKVSFDQSSSFQDQIKLAVRERKRLKDRDPELAKRFPDRYHFAGEELGAKAEEYKRVEIQQASEKEPATMHVTYVDQEGEKKTMSVKVAQRIWAIDKVGNTGKCFVITDKGDILSSDIKPSEPPKNENGTIMWNLSQAKLLHAGGIMKSDTAKELIDDRFVMIDDLNKKLHGNRDYEELQDILTVVSQKTPTASPVP